MIRIKKTIKTFVNRRVVSTMLAVVLILSMGLSNVTYGQEVTVQSVSSEGEPRQPDEQPASSEGLLQQPDEQPVLPEGGDLQPMEPDDPIAQQDQEIQEQEREIPADETMENHEAYYAEISSNFALPVEANTAYDGEEIYLWAGVRSAEGQEIAADTLEQTAGVDSEACYKGNIDLAESKGLLGEGGNYYAVSVGNLSEDEKQDSVDLRLQSLAINQIPIEAEQIRAAGNAGIAIEEGIAVGFFAGDPSTLEVRVTENTERTELKIEYFFEKKSEESEPDKQEQSDRATLPEAEMQALGDPGTSVTAQVTVGLQQGNDYLITPQEMGIRSDLAESYGYIDTVDQATAVSALDVLVSVHEKMLADDFSADTCRNFLEVNAGGSISRILSEDTYSFSFAINESYPYDPDSTYGSYGYTGYTVNQAIVGQGDKVDFFYYADPSYMDLFTWFEKDGEKVGKISVNQGETISLTLTGFIYMFGSYKKEYMTEKDYWKGIEDATLEYVEAGTGKRTTIPGAVTDEEGKVTLTFDQPGTFYVSAEKDGTDGEYITSPWLEVTVAGTVQTAGLQSLLVHTETTPKDSNVLLKNVTDTYACDQIFSAERYTYTLPDQSDDIAKVSNSRLRFRAMPQTDGAKVILKYNGTEMDITWKSGASKMADFMKAGKNTFTLEVIPPEGSSEEKGVYTFTFTALPTLTSLAVKSGTVGMGFEQDFVKTEKNYSLVIPTETELLNFEAEATDASYGITYNDSAFPQVSVKGKDRVEVKVTAGEGDAKATSIYTIMLKRVSEQSLRMNVSPADAIVKVYDDKKNEIPPQADGRYKGTFAAKSYSYVVTKYGYIAQTGQVPAEGGTLNITLKKAGADGLAELPSVWDSFRGNKDNMGITSAETPAAKEDVSLLWSAKIGKNWSDAPSPQIVVGDHLILMAGKEIVKIDRKTGEVTLRKPMAGSPSFSNTPPTYARGMVFCPLGNGTIQAFNAETLDSLWLYNDPLKGQSLSPITYSDGYIYAGFWTGEVKNANYVCISVTDEDPEKTDELKTATWSHTQKGGFYWAGSVVAGKYNIVGSDDGTSTFSGDATLYSFEKESGKIVSQIKLPGAGDQRSSIAYDEASKRVYFTTKNGCLCSALVDPGTGKLTEVRQKKYNAQATSTPVVYKGKVYFATGGGISASGSKGNLVVADAETLDLVYVVDLKGYPQCSPLLSTAYEEETGYIYLYTTYNNMPGGITMLKAKPEATSAAEVEVVELYEAEGVTGYCTVSIICDEKGTLYYKNDSGNVLAVGVPDYKTVIRLIDRIGEVTLEREHLIQNAKRAYEALDQEQRDKISNYSVLQAAETRLTQLKEEEARKKAEEARKKAEEEARKKAEEEARKKAEEEARKKAEEEARKKAEEEARKKAEEDARKKADDEANRTAGSSVVNGQENNSGERQMAQGSTRSLSSSATVRSNGSSNEQASKSDDKKPIETGEGRMTPDMEKELLGSMEQAVSLIKERDKLNSEDIGELLNVYRKLNQLSSEDIKIIKDRPEYKAYEKMTLQAGEENHKNDSLGIDASVNSEEVLPWYVTMKVSSSQLTKDQDQKLAAVIGDKGKLLYMVDITFINLLTGEGWEPEDSLSLRFLLSEDEDYEQYMAVHFMDQDVPELIEGSVQNGFLEINAVSFSPYGILGYNGTLEDIIEVKEQNSIPRIWFLIGIAAAAAIGVLFVNRRREKND